MAIASQQYTPGVGSTFAHTDWNTEMSEIYNNLNSITNAQINAGAAIAYSKLNLTGGIVNADVNASAAIAISKTTLGTYTADATWGPTLGATGSMTYTSTSINMATWARIGSRIFFTIDCTGTTGGTASDILTFTLPATPSTIYIGGGGLVIDTGSSPVGATWVYDSSTAKVHVRRYDDANFGLGSGRRFIINGSYPI